MVGIPLCWILTVFRKLGGVFLSQSDKVKKPKKILLMKPSEMGAIVLAYPLMQQLKSDYPNSRLFFLTFQSNQHLFDVLDCVPKKNVWLIRDNSIGVFIKDVCVTILKMRRERFDVMIDLEFFSRFTAILGYLSKCPVRIGFHRYKIEGVYRGDLLTHRAAYNAYLHISEMFLSLAEYIKLPDKSSPESAQQFPKKCVNLPQFAPSDTQISRLRKKLADAEIAADSRIFLIGPGEGRIPLREWPLENFVELADKILADPKHVVIMIGMKDPSAKAQTIADQVSASNRCLNWMGNTSMQELLTLFTLSDALIMNDSGMAHLAALTPIRQYVLFGPETPRIFASLSPHSHVFYVQLACSPCLSVYNHRNSACRDNQCLKLIKPQQVADTIFL